MARSATFDDLGGTGSWSVRAGTTWTRAFTLKDDGVARNLAGSTVAARITASETSTTALKTPTVTVTNAAAGQFTVTVAAAQADLAAGRYWWALQVTDAGGVETPLCSGPFVVHPWSIA